MREDAMRRSAATVNGLALLMSLSAGAAFPQAYPTKPIRIIAPTVAGTPPDVRARWLAERLSLAAGVARFEDVTSWSVRSM
jgi:tripartite-type tricarboxylate transporter receptor subunit TctC